MAGALAVWSHSRRLALARRRWLPLYSERGGYDLGPVGLTTVAEHGRQWRNVHVVTTLLAARKNDVAAIG